MSFQSISNLLSPFILAAIIALGSWVNKIEERQYQQKTEYATKLELAATAGRMEHMLSQFVRTYEQFRKEDRESFGDAMKRIENRQLDLGRRLSDLSAATAKRN
jgi:hypothetical protein